MLKPAPRPIIPESTAGQHRQLTPTATSKTRTLPRRDATAATSEPTKLVSAAGIFFPASCTELSNTAPEYWLQSTRPAQPAWARAARRISEPANRSTGLQFSCTSSAFSNAQRVVFPSYAKPWL